MAALDGLRILDMTQYEAGTSCTQSLAFLGADVVKIEQPVVGDPGRGRASGATIDREYFVNWNSNKRSVTLDLTNNHGRNTLLRMLPKYDVFVENYGPGVVEKLDIGYDVMKEVHPELIYVRIKGFGTSGPYAQYKCMDMVAQAASGAFSVTGEPDGPPMRPGPTIGDSGTGMQAALAISAAYIQKIRTGEGQLIELSMQEAMTYYMRTQISSTNFGERPTPRSGNGNHAFVSLYPTLGGGPNDFVFLMAVNPRMWAGVCKAIGKPDLLEEEQFSSDIRQAQNQSLLKDEITKWTLSHSKQECMTKLAENGVCASYVYETNELYQDPHLLERGFIKEVSHADHGDVKLLGWPARMSKSQVEMTASPLLGEHTDEVLREDLGLSPTEIQSLRHGGSIGSELLDRPVR